MHHCRQEEDTAKLAKQFAASLAHLMSQKQTIHLNIALEGDLGAGKTTFARYLLQSLGHGGRVKSPTYTLCEPYLLQIHQHPFTVYHFDLYRMRDPLEWQDTGFAEHFDTTGLCLIEWPEKAEGTLPAFDIQIQLMAGADENERAITFHGLSAEGNTVVEALKNHPR